MELIEDLTGAAKQHLQRTGQPLVTLCYAQSLDGSITAERGRALVLSSEDSFRFVHRVRSANDAILVGIGTVLADDPQLTVRLVDGPQPQPIILDTRLRFPLQARLLERPGPKPWIFSSESANPDRQRLLEARGARVFRLPAASDRLINLAELLKCLGQMGIASLMVEGGARVITSLLQERLANYLVVTLVPAYVGGVRALESPLFENHGTPPPRDTLGLPRLSEPSYTTFGRDLVITGWLE